jgi:hypothetical protein
MKYENSPEPLPPNQVSWLLILLVCATVLPGVAALTMSGCGEGSLHIKVWTFDYQFTKKVAVMLNLN